MKNISTSWGETLPLTVEAEDATEATLYIGLTGDATVTRTAQFVEGVADVSVSAEDMQIPPGEYSYQVSITYSNGDLRKFPDSELPRLTVLETIDMPGGS